MLTLLLTFIYFNGFYGIKSLSKTIQVYFSNLIECDEEAIISSKELYTANGLTVKKQGK